MQSTHDNTHLSVNIPKFQEDVIHISNGMLLLLLLLLSHHSRVQLCATP